MKIENLSLNSLYFVIAYAEIVAVGLALLVLWSGVIWSEVRRDIFIWEKNILLVSRCLIIFGLVTTQGLWIHWYMLIGSGRYLEASGYVGNIRWLLMISTAITVLGLYLNLINAWLYGLQRLVILYLILSHLILYFYFVWSY